MSSAAGLLLRARASARTLSSALKPYKGAVGAEASSPLSSSRSQVSSPTRRIARKPRLPVESSCLVTMMPLHSAIASARLRSILSPESQSWGLIPQGATTTAAAIFIGYPHPSAENDLWIHQQPRKELSRSMAQHDAGCTYTS